MYEYSCRVSRVIDGDTIEAEIDLGFSIKKREIIRLGGINAAELNSPDPIERALAVKAKLWLSQRADLVTRIRTVKDKRDKYGRLLGYLYVGDATTPLNDQMFDLPGVAVYE